MKSFGNEQSADHHQERQPQYLECGMFDDEIAHGVDKEDHDNHGNNDRHDHDDHMVGKADGGKNAVEGEDDVQ